MIPSTFLHFIYKKVIFIPIMQPKMNAKQTLKSEQTRRSSSTSNINRRQVTVTRRANTHPYIRNKINSENCFKCDQNQDYISNLSARFTRIENLVENLNKAVKSTTLTRKVVSPTSSAFGSVDLSKMSINELLNFSSQLGIHLFNKFDKEKKNSSSSSAPNSPPTRNDDKENKILKNIEIEANANSNDFQNAH